MCGRGPFFVSGITPDLFTTTTSETQFDNGAMQQHMTHSIRSIVHAMLWLPVRCILVVCDVRRLLHVVVLVAALLLLLP